MAGFYAASIPHPTPSKISISSIYDATMSVIHPVVTAGSNRCKYVLNTLTMFFVFAETDYYQSQMKKMFSILLNDIIIFKGIKFPYIWDCTSLKYLFHHNYFLLDGETLIFLLLYTRFPLSVILTFL